MNYQKDKKTERKTVEAKNVTSKKQARIAIKTGVKGGSNAPCWA